jgi:hypothetical protein
LLLFGAFLLFRFSPGALGIHLASIATAFRFGLARDNSRAKAVERDIRISAEGVRSDGELLPRSLVADGWYQPRARGSTIRLFDKRKRIIFEARVSTEEQAQEMLRALGLDASQKRAEFRTVSPLAVRQQTGIGAGALAMAVMLLSRHFLHAAGPWPFISILAAFTCFVLIPAKVTVGVDGVLVKWLWQNRFIPMSEIVTIHAEGPTRIRLELAGGRVEIISTASAKQRSRGGVFTERRDMILARIREAWQTHRARGPGADVAALVARGTRSLEEWKKALATLESADAGYRQAALREEDLWRVVEDPRASEDARAAAALLLRKSLDAPGKARVRVAAEATASPKLRVALEASISDDDAAALAALDEVEVKARRAGASEDR